MAKEKVIRKGILGFFLLSFIIWGSGFILWNISSLFGDPCSDDFGDYLFLSFRCIIKDTKFNPEDDICTAWKISTECGDSCKFIEITTQDASFKDKVMQLGFDTECVGWREKNICEKEPNAEGCFCDEWKDTDHNIRGYACPGTCRNITANRCRVYGFNHYNTPIVLEGTYIFDRCEIKSTTDKIISPDNFSMEIYYENISMCEQCYEYEQTCIKSHLPNRCESNNSQYMWEVRINKKSDEFTKDGRIFYSCDAFAYTWNNQTLYDEYCITKEKICRKKTIQDESCEDMWTAILKDYVYCEGNNQFRKEDCGLLYGPQINTDKLVDIYKERCR